MSRRSRARVRDTHPTEDEIAGGQRAVDRSTGGLPGPGADRRHRVEAEETCSRRRRGRSERLEHADQSRMGRDVRNDPVLPVVGRVPALVPALPSRAEEIDEPHVVYGERARRPACACAATTAAPAPTSASRMRTARSGTSSPGTGTPIHTSPPGSCRRHGRSRRPARRAASPASLSRLGSLRGGSGTARPKAKTAGAANRHARARPRERDHRRPRRGVGHATVWRDEPDPPTGRGIARTGVTAIVTGRGGAVLDPPLAAGVAVLNGAGELTGSLQICGMGSGRDACLPDLDDGRRTRL